MKENWKGWLIKTHNYIKFNKDLSETLAKEGFRKIAFWYCDIDNFKLFNESFGYEAGDQLLKSLAQLFDECARKDELFCRETSDHYVGIRYYKEPSDGEAGTLSYLQAAILPPGTQHGVLLCGYAGVSAYGQ